MVAMVRTPPRRSQLATSASPLRRRVSQHCRSRHDEKQRRRLLHPVGLPEQLLHVGHVGRFVRAEQALLDAVHLGGDHQRLPVAVEVVLDLRPDVAQAPPL